MFNHLADWHGVEAYRRFACPRQVGDAVSDELRASVAFEHTIVCDFLISVYHVIFTPTQVRPCTLSCCHHLAVCTYKRWLSLEFLRMTNGSCSWRLGSLLPGRS